MQVSLRSRRLVLIAALALGSSWAAARSASAELTGRALSLGRFVAALPSEWFSADPRELWINGAHVRIVSGRSDEPLPALLDTLERTCRARSQIVTAPLRSWVRRGVPSLADGILRFESEREGLIACFDLGDAPLGAWGLAHKLERFAASGDLAALGALRVVRAEARDEGAFFVAALSEGPLPLATLFPTQGDAPGFDLEDVGRPSQGRRLFTALQQGKEPALIVYELANGADRAFHELLSGFDRAGYERLAMRGGDAPAALFSRSGEHRLLVTSRARGRAQLSIVSLGGVFPRNSERRRAETGNE